MRRILLSGLAVFLGLLATVLTTRAEPPAPAGGGQGSSGSGPVFSDEDKDLQRAAARSLLVSLRQELADGKKVITVPPGDYRFDRGAGVLIQKAEDVQIEATGATFWFGPDRGVVLEKCRRVKLRGLTIDADPLPWTQGVIETIDRQAKTIVFRIDAGYSVPEGKRLTQPGRILFFDGESRRELPVFDDQATAFEALGERRYQITQFASARVFTSPVPGRPVQAGDRVAFFIMYGGGANVELRGCEGVTLEKVTNHAASAFAFHETQGPGGNQYLGCRLTRRPDTDRLMASRADCFHSYLMEKGPRIEGCEFSHSGDDLINIHGFFGLVLRAISPQEAIVVSPFGEILGAGSRVKICDPEASTQPRDVTVKSAEPVNDPELLAEVKAFPAALLSKQGLRIRDLAGCQVARVVVEGDAGWQPYEIVSSPDRSGRGAIVRNNHLHDGHVRAVLLKSHDILVEENRIERTGHGGIVVEPEFFWLEGPFAKNIRIRGNTLVRNGWASMDQSGFGVSHAAIQVGCHFGKRMFPRTLGAGMVNEDIEITGNRIEEPAGYAIMVMNTRRATVADNRITAPFAAGEQPAFYDFSRLPQGADLLSEEQRTALRSPREAIFVFGSEEITLRGNTVEQAPAFLPKPDAPK
jgi:hypothetical protein